ncbi:MAG TPA: glutamate racemase, partial [Sphingobacteriaceae bacterium]|nr:glutamate racemase [Sphingobacteriaceae bacterium]
MGPIGIFDSGFGGLTVFRAIEKRLPEYDYLYLGDNARVPYGNRSHETVYEYTKECVEILFEMGCSLVVLACNTASAKALRTIQQGDLPLYEDMKRVLGVIRPTAESVGQFSQSGEIGILATTGTVVSNAYPLEINKFFPDITVYQQACPMWVPLIEAGDLDSPATHYYTRLYLNALLAQSPQIDTVVMACTHYPLLEDLIRQYLPASI